MSQNAGPTGLIALLALLGAAPAAAQACPNPSSLGADLPPVLQPVRYLADDALGGRLAGSPGERCAGDYIAGRFRALGLRPAGADGTYFQPLALASALNPHAPSGEGRNVAALLVGRDPTLRGEIVVIGAHYDHLGLGEFGSLAPGSNEIHNGADDNASGVAAMLHAAEALAADPPARSVLFLAFTGEESGLLGSAYWVAHPTLPVDSLRAMINLDMVGRLGDGPLIVYGVDTAAEWRSLLDDVSSARALEMTFHGEGYGPSDHTSFYTRDIPVLHFFTNTHSDYHQPGDDWEKIDVDGLETVAQVVAAVARRVAEPELRITLRRGAGTPPAPAGSAPSPGYGSWLGSVPDFTPVDHGVKLSGVSPGSPAEGAGLRAGDILVGLGDHEVADLQALTDALRAHKPGDEVVVRYVRDGREQSVRLVLGQRGQR